MPRECDVFSAPILLLPFFVLLYTWWKGSKALDILVHVNLVFSQRLHLLFLPQVVYHHSELVDFHRTDARSYYYTYLPYRLVPQSTLYLMIIFRFLFIIDCRYRHTGISHNPFIF
jgi:hypothetical protein